MPCIAAIFSPVAGILAPIAPVFAAVADVLATISAVALRAGARERCRRGQKRGEYHGRAHDGLDAIHVTLHSGALNPLTVARAKGFNEFSGVGGVDSRLTIYVVQ